jgi:hypothetical protein
MSAYASPTLSEGLRVAVGAAGRDLCTPSYGVPRRFGPLDGAFRRRHSSTRYRLAAARSSRLLGVDLQRESDVYQGRAHEQPGCCECQRGRGPGHYPLAVALPQGPGRDDTARIDVLGSQITAATVVLVGLLLIFGSQFTLFAMWFDMESNKDLR